MLIMSLCNRVKLSVWDIPFVSFAFLLVDLVELDQSLEVLFGEASGSMDPQQPVQKRPQRVRQAGKQKYEHLFMKSFKAD